MSLIFICVRRKTARFTGGKFEQLTRKTALSPMARRHIICWIHHTTRNRFQCDDNTESLLPRPPPFHFHQYICIVTVGRKIEKRRK